MSGPAPTAVPDVQVVTHGEIPASAVDHARTKVASALHHARDPVLFARLRLTVLPDPAASRPAMAQLNVDLNGLAVRTQAARPTLREAVDEVCDRLAERLQRCSGDWEDIRGRRPQDEAHEWRHARRPSERPQYFPRPAEERQIIRHKSFGLQRSTVDEAAFDMEMLGYQFHLFTEDGTGSDSVLYYVDDDPRLRLSQLKPDPDRVTPGAEFVSVSPQRPPVLRTVEAVARLEAAGWPFVFFEDAMTRRGSVVYRRYDGHYGLITPA